MAWTRIRLKAFGGPGMLEVGTVPDLPQPVAGESPERVSRAAFTDVTARPDLIRSPGTPPIEAKAGPDQDAG